MIMMMMMMMNDEPERIIKEAPVACFKVLSQNRLV
jgi:hypothetical protein